jgi:hypothetical protein
MSDKDVNALRAENAELRRLLVKNQWGGLTPLGRGHRPGWVVAAVLVQT